ncbi:hypothetical protein [Absidia glauca]|uniref:Uncharacterized protein n=1 Tax=Absidia glauca TaxID=4829 RepID=A0A163JJT4_ABSGL|nr:hypothetical protein [Absidia glauca]
MTTTLFSSKTNNASTSLDKMMGMFLPTSSSSPSIPPSSFRTAKPTYANDPELYMGDDSDADYTQALMQSGLFSTPQDSEDPTVVSLNRLRLMLAHLDPPSPSLHKGKSKHYH